MYKMRFAVPDDAAELLAIYAPYVETTSNSFEWEVPSQEEFRSRVESITAEYPYIICADESGAAVGYAYAHRQKERAAYRWNAELSVYIKNNCTGRGLGKKLYLAMFELLKLQNVENVYGVVTSPNMRSQRLHESLGFIPRGVFRSTGFKFGRWHDVIEYELAIGRHSVPPEEFTPFPKVDRAAAEAVLARFSEN